MSKLGISGNSITLAASIQEISRQVNRWTDLTAATVEVARVR